MTRSRLITFDVYTALIDFESGLVPAVRKACGEGIDAVPLVRSWRAKQLEYAQISNSLQRGRIPFRVLTQRALEYTFARAGQPLSSEQTDALVTAWNRLPPWPEAHSTLSELKTRGYALGTLSNGDEKMLRAVLEGFAVVFDHVLASDHAGHYKPHPAIYALPTRMLGLEPREVLHVAGSATDVLGSKSAGLPCAWSNRQGDRMVDPQVQPDHELRDLAGLLEIL